MTKDRILIVDDEANARSALSELLSGEGYQVETAADGFKALRKLAEQRPHLVLTDLKMPGMNGLDLLRKMREQDPGVIVVVMTAFGAVETAVAAMRHGAADYLTKPLDFRALLLVLERELERARRRTDGWPGRARAARRDEFQKVIANAAAMQEILKTVAQVASSRATVLLTGEAGTGKELIAAAIHERSPRAKGPLVRVHCTGSGAEHLAAELPRRLLEAHGGTVFLDEISGVSPAVQSMLLRFLQEHEVSMPADLAPVAPTPATGCASGVGVSVDVRTIAATNRDLAAEVAAGRFREDLYYKLNIVNVALPPLRARVSDIPPLARFFARKHAEEHGRKIEGFTDEALERLAAYRWPGNIDELEQTVERAVVMATGSLITRSELPIQLAPTGGDEEIRIPGSTLQSIENHVIRKTLEATGGSTSRAAEILGVSVRKIQYKLHEYESAPKSGAPALRPAKSSRPPP